MLSCHPGQFEAICGVSSSASCWHLWRIKTAVTDCFPLKIWKNIFKLTILPSLPLCLNNILTNLAVRIFFNLFQLLFLKPIKEKKKKELNLQDGSNLMLYDYKGPKPVVTANTTPGQRDHSVEIWSVNNFRIRHQNICTDASQLPITAACTTQLPKALWYALMNKHL